MSVPNGGVTFTPDDVVRKLQELFPLEFRIVMLSVTNVKQAELIQDLGQIVEGQRATANEDAWRREDDGKGGKRE